MHDTGLHDRVGVDRADRVGQPGQPVAAHDENVLDAAIAQVGEDLGPKLGALGILDPAGQGVFSAVGVHADAQVRDLGGDHPGVADPDADAVDVDDRVYRSIVRNCQALIWSRSPGTRHLRRALSVRSP